MTQSCNWLVESCKRSSPIMMTRFAMVRFLIKRIHLCESLWSVNFPETIILTQGNVPIFQQYFVWNGQILPPFQWNEVIRRDELSGKFCRESEQNSCVLNSISTDQYRKNSSPRNKIKTMHLQIHQSFLEAVNFQLWKSDAYLLFDGAVRWFKFWTSRIHLQKTNERWHHLEVISLILTIKLQAMNSKIHLLSYMTQR